MICHCLYVIAVGLWIIQPLVEVEGFRDGKSIETERCLICAVNAIRACGTMSFLMKFAI